MARPKKNEEDLLETVGVKLSSETIKILDEIASRTETSRSWAGRRLILLGLEAYLRDRRAVFNQLESLSPAPSPAQSPAPSVDADRIRRDAEATLAVLEARDAAEGRKSARRKKAS